MSWTVERIGTLKVLWAEGLSCSQIAAALGGVTRNGVIGKVHRMRLDKRAKTYQPRKHIEQTAKLRQATTTQTRRSTSFKPPPPPELDEATDLPADTPTAPVTLIELQDHHCRWPIGTPGTPDFVFCGGDKRDGHSYCARHCRMAYQPAAQRRFRSTWRGAPPRAKEVAI